VGADAGRAALWVNGARDCMWTTEWSMAAAATRSPRS